MVALDIFFLSILLSQETECPQFFVGAKNDVWKVYPMKTKLHKGWALQDYTTEKECLLANKINNERSELSDT